MKRFVIMVFIIGLFIVNIPITKAEELTFAQIGEKIKTYKMPEGEHSEYLAQKLLERSTIDVTSNKITINYNYDAERDDFLDADPSIKTEFSSSGDEISFTFSDNKNDKYTETRAFIDNAWIMDLICVVGTLKGYSENDILNWIKVTSELEDFSEYGIEIKTFDYSYTASPETTVSGKGIDTFKIDIKKFNLGYTNMKYGFIKNGNKIDLKIADMMQKEDTTYSYYLCIGDKTDGITYENDYKAINMENNVFITDVTDIYELNGDLKIYIAEKSADSYKDIMTGAVLKRLAQKDLSKRISVNLTKDKTEFKVNEVYSTERALKLNYKIGQISDTKILSLIKSGDQKGLNDLLTYAKISNGVEGTLNKNETILGKVKIKDNAYYYVYYEIEDEDGKYYPIEDINLYMGDKEGNLISYTSNKFVWNDEEKVPDNPKTGIKNYLIVGSMGLLMVIGIFKFTKKRSLFRKI